MSKQVTAQFSSEGLILSGYQKKLKTMKKKFFVLYEDTLCSVARLEYYDNEKKFKSGMAPKRVIKLKSCFNINRRFDTKHEYVVALSTKDGGFGIVLETEREMFKWLDVLLSLQQKDSNATDLLRPSFEHVWQVIVQKKGLAENKGIYGNYHICLTGKSITFIRIDSEKTQSEDYRMDNVEFLLTSIRRCGDSQCFFYMEVGRQSVIGPGELWMQTEDSLIAQNMHQMIFSMMSTKNDANIEPMRKRSSSANEASKPVNVSQKRSAQIENKLNSSPQSTICYGRDRCDSLPSRNRSSSECSNPSIILSSGANIRNIAVSGFRTHSYQRHSNSPPISSNVGYSESEESSISIDEPDDNGSFLSFRYISRSSDGVIPEENSDDVILSDVKSTGLTKKIENEKNDQFSKHQNNFDENYIPMASKHMRKNQGYNSLRPDIKFFEYTSDVSPSQITDMDSQFDRPARTYSIGSKVDHNKLKKPFSSCNDAEQNFHRVRAFSVGSRVNNNNISKNIMECKKLLNVNIFNEKKSTSAPLLLHKSHNSVDRMGDLMELDFSKSLRSRTSTESEIISSKNLTNIKQYQTEIKDPLNAETISKESTNCDCLLPKVATSDTKIDNGYLEMKPVGNLLSKSHSKLNDCTLISNEYLSNTQKNIDISDGRIGGKNQSHLYNHGSLVTDTEAVDVENKIVRNNIQPSLHNSKVKSTMQIQHKKIHTVQEDQNNFKTACKQSTNSTSSQIDDGGNVNTLNLSSKYAKLTLDSECYKIKMDLLNFHKKLQTDNVEYLKPLNCANKQKDIGNKFVQENWKLAHSLSGEDYDYKNINNELKKSTGYKILHIKSDSSLQSHKIYKRSKLEGQPCALKETISTGVNCTSLSPLSPSSSKICSSSSLSTTCLNNALLTIPGITTKELNCNTKLINHNTDAKANLTITSRPSSINLEHELYYATLDLPHSSTDLNTKTNMISAENSILSSTAVLGENNTYAKIDFDHSDSSSTSSKIIDS